MLLIVIVSLAIFLHGIISRLAIFSKYDSVKRFLLVGSLVGLLYSFILYETYGISWNMLSGLLTYAFICELYIFMFTMTISSISATLLINLLLAKTLSQDDIAQLYKSEQMVLNRIERLLAIQLIQEDVAKSLILTNKGENLARIFAKFRSFFGHPDVSITPTKTFGNINK